MNIFLRELRANLKGLLIWLSCALLLLAGVMGKYAGLSADQQQINQLMADMPKAMQLMVGGGAFDLSKISGFVGIFFGYLLLVASVYALTLGTSVSSREERDKTAEFLLSKPVARSTVLMIKLLATVCCMLVFALVMFAATAGFVASMDAKAALTGEIAYLFVAMLLVQLVFLGVGAALAATAKDARHAGRVGMAVLFAAYLLSLAMLLSDKLTFMRPLTPFAYFDAAAILNDGASISVIYALVSLLIGAGTAAVAIIIGDRRDIRA